PAVSAWKRSQRERLAPSRSASVRSASRKDEPERSQVDSRASERSASSRLQAVKAAAVRTTLAPKARLKSARWKRAPRRLVAPKATAQRLVRSMSAKDRSQASNRAWSTCEKASWTPEWLSGSAKLQRVKTASRRSACAKRQRVNRQ